MALKDGVPITVLIMEIQLSFRSRGNIPNNPFIANISVSV